MIAKVIPQMPQTIAKKMASYTHTPLGYMAAICDDHGLLALAWQQTPFDNQLEDSDVSRETITQLHAYLAGRLQQFHVPISPNAVSPAMRKWLDAIAAVPYGSSVSYRELAALWGNGKAARAAGSACQKNPIPIIIPCHRIIGSDGSYDKYSGGDRSTPTGEANIARKKALLDLEAGLLKII